MEQVESILISITLFITTAVVVIAILNFILKNRLIGSGHTNPEVIRLLSQLFDHKVAVLKWGLILLSGGIGLIVINYIPEAKELESPLPYGIELIFIAGGFLGYYLNVRRKDIQE